MSDLLDKQAEIERLAKDTESTDAWYADDSDPYENLIAIRPKGKDDEEYGQIVDHAIVLYVVRTNPALMLYLCSEVR